MKKPFVPGAKVYLSGAMSGLPGHNYRAFMRAERALSKAGFQVLNPARTRIPASIIATGNRPKIWRAFMSEAQSQVRQADIVLAMPKGAFGSLKGWELSRGARIEKQWAGQLGKHWIEFPGRMEYLVKGRPSTNIAINAFSGLGKGFRSILRKLLTAFGSPWQGIEAEKDPAGYQATYESMRPGGRGPTLRKKFGGAGIRPLGSSQLTYKERMRGAFLAGSRPRSNLGINSFSGMQEGGMAQASRHELTDFGSAWRGLIKIGRGIERILELPEGMTALHYKPPGISSRLAQKFAKRIEVIGVDELEIKQLRSEAAAFLKQLRTAERYGFNTPVLVSENGEKGRLLRGALLHERTHQLRWMNKEWNTKISIAENYPIAYSKFKKYGYAEYRMYEEGIAYGVEQNYLSKFIPRPKNALREDVVNIARKAGAIKDKQVQSTVNEIMSMRLQQLSRGQYSQTLNIPRGARTMMSGGN